MHNETLDVEEAASLLKAETDTVMQLARAGDLPGAKIGKSWVFMRSDLISFLMKRIAEDTSIRRNNSPKALGYVMQRPAHGRTKPRPVLPNLK